jgi:hypothetical protein
MHGGSFVFRRICSTGDILIVRYTSDPTASNYRKEYVRVRFWAKSPSKICRAMPKNGSLCFLRYDIVVVDAALQPQFMSVNERS